VPDLRDSTLLSSGDAYAGLHAAYVAFDAGAMELAESSVYRIAVHVGAPHRLWDKRGGRSEVGAHARGDIVVTTLGEPRAVRWDRATSLLALSLAPAIVRDVATASGTRPDRIAGCFSRREPGLETLAFDLLRELAAGMPSGPLYGEETAARLAARLLDGYGTQRVLARGGLSQVILKRVVAYMHDAMSQRISLAGLAELADLSAFHFARQFRSSMGIAPHAYLVRVRVEEAMRQILNGATPSQAAARVGFSSQGHMTQHMRRAFGVTPGRLQAKSPRNS
jgi:AraC family transcriptional regulator